MSEKIRERRDALRWIEARKRCPEEAAITARFSLARRLTMSAAKRREWQVRDVMKGKSAVVCCLRRRTLRHRYAHAMVMTKRMSRHPGNMFDNGVVHVLSLRCCADADSHCRHRSPVYVDGSFHISVVTERAAIRQIYAARHIAGVR